MITRYDVDGDLHDRIDGEFVLHSDYLKCKEALREALEWWGCAGSPRSVKEEDAKRIASLRKEFDL